MCSHPEHRYEVLSDGQIDETHVLTDEEIRIPWGLFELKATLTTCTTATSEEVPNG